MTCVPGRVLRLGVSVLGVGLGACASSPPEKPAPAAGSGLAGTSWRLVEFRSGNHTRLAPDDRDQYTIEFRGDGTLLARIDCNRGQGRWKSFGTRLELSSLSLTRRACAPGSLHDQMARQWANIKSYVIKDGQLHLVLMADGGIYEFEPVSGGGQRRRVGGQARAYR